MKLMTHAWPRLKVKINKKNQNLDTIIVAYKLVALRNKKKMLGIVLKDKSHSIVKNVVVVVVIIIYREQRLNINEWI